MGLKFPPRVGQVLLCEFPSSLTPPEMVKTRPVVVVTPRLTGRSGLVGIVPLSTTAPHPICSHPCRVAMSSMPRPLQATTLEIWAKCDMVYTFCLARLDRFKSGKDRNSGKRLYDSGQLTGAEMDEVRRCVAAAFGITPRLLNE